MSSLTRIVIARPWLLLVAYVALTAAGHLRHGIGALAWLAPLPALLWLRLTPRARVRWLLLPVGMVAWTLATTKIITDPLPLPFALVFGVPMGVILTLPYLAYDALRRRGASFVVFPALMAIAEWAQYTFTPLASWGAAGYSQLENLPLLQVAALGGIVAVGFVMHLLPAAIDRWLAEGAGRPGRRLGLTALVAVMAHGFGAARMAASEADDPPMMTVAAIGTDSTTRGLPLPSAQEAAIWDTAMQDRTRQATAAGAEMVVWTEAAALVWPDDEQEWLDTRAADARALGIELVAGYVTPVSTDPLMYENRYAWFRPDGALHHAYRKARPVLMEPAIAGPGASPVVETGTARLGGAICYDFDYPDLARAHGRRGVDLVAVPSSDWRGIDPIHTQMAAVRAIEGGFSMVRSTRWGLSAAVDATGRPRGWHRGDAGVMVARVPVAHRWTLFAQVGEWVVGLSGGLVLVALIGVIRRRRMA